MVASKVRRLPPEEISRLQELGMITPPELIPAEHMPHREVTPIRWGRGTYCYQGFRGKR